jgi:hypothetical protein
MGVFTAPFFNPMAVDKLSADQIENWKRVKEALEESGKTDCLFYKRAVSIMKTGRDPIKW